MRRLSVAAISLSSCAAIVAMLAVPASAHDGGRDGGHDGRGHDDAVTAPVVAPAAPAVANDDSADDDAMEATNDAMEATNDDASDDAASDDGVEIEATLTGSSVGGPVIAGAAAGGRPWVITEGEVEFEDGVLTASITGLVIPPGGTNPLTSLSVSVVCGGAIAATSAAVPFSTAGNAMVSQALTVPSTCLAPQVLVHPQTNTKVYIAFG
ncbi:MAG: hypothetical protein WCP95_15220 [Actinomycetes bacterium]